MVGQVVVETCSDKEKEYMYKSWTEEDEQNYEVEYQKSQISLENNVSDIGLKYDSQKQIYFNQRIVYDYVTGIENKT